MKKIYVCILLYSISFSKVWAQQWNWLFEPLPVEDTDLGTYAYAKGVASDQYGNVYINWLSEHPSITIGNQTYDGSSYYPGRSFTMKLNAAGAVQWVNATGASDRLATNAIISDAEGTIYSASEITGTYSIQNYAFDTQNALYNTIISKTATNGELVWVKSFSITGNPSDQDAYINRFIRPYSIALDPSGNLYVCGQMRGITGVFGNVSVPAQGIEGFFIAKLNSAGDVLWVNSSAQSGYLGPMHLSCDGAGNVYMASSYSGNQAVQFGQTTVGGDAMGHIFVVKYDPSGNMVWIKSHGGLAPSYYLFTTGIAVDGNDNVYLGGVLNYPSIMFDNFNITTPAGVANQGFVVKYSSQGNVQWANNIGSYSFLRDLKTDQSGSLYTLINFYSPQITLGNITLNNEAGSNGCIAKMNTNGNYQWAEQIGGTGNVAMVMDINKSSNTICVSGNYTNIRLGTQTFTAPVAANLFAAKFTPQTLSTANPQVKSTVAFPNPTGNVLHINVDHDTEYKVTDMSGRVISNGLTKSGNIDVLSLTEGIYTVIIEGAAIKFIKE